MQTYSTLAQWLDHCEKLHPKTIDMGLDRLRAVAARMHGGAGVRFDCPVFTVAGTNGKGSTCAMLASILRQSGYHTGLFTSPHLVQFTERCRIDNQDIDEAVLCRHFAAVEEARGDITLTYFEFTTLAILDALASAHLDAVVLEVGLGGRLDAVNLIDTDCAVLTSIDIDHVEFLGPTREAIGFEKAGIMRPGRPAIVSDPVPPASVIAHAQEIGADLWLVGRDFNTAGDKQQWNWAGRGRRYSGLAYPALRGANQLVNAAGVLAALTALRDRLPVTAQAIRLGLAFVELPGRFQMIPGQPTLILDVAHNPHAVAALVANLDTMPYAPVTHAVFGAMADKDVQNILHRMYPIVDKWYFTDLPTPRAASAQALMDMWETEQKQGSESRVLPAEAHMFTGAREALHAALAAAGETDRIVVFGSFVTVGEVLQEPLPRLNAPHLSSPAGA